MVVWEGATQYLTENAARHTLAILTKAAQGSRLILTFIQQDFFDGTNTYQAAGA